MLGSLRLELRFKNHSDADENDDRSRADGKDETLQRIHVEQDFRLRDFLRPAITD